MQESKVTKGARKDKGEGVYHCQRKRRKEEEEEEERGEEEEEEEEVVCIGARAKRKRRVWVPMKEKGGVVRGCQSWEIEKACMGAKGWAGRRCVGTRPTV